MAGELAGVAHGIGEQLGPWLAEARNGGRVSVPESVRVPLAAWFASRRAGPTLFLAPTPARALAIAEEVGFFLAGIPVARLGERDRLPYEVVRDERAGGLDRSRALALLSGSDPALVVASWSALTEHCPGPQERLGGVDLRVGDATNPADLARRLEVLGYAVEHVADRPATVARRGGIVDVYPAGAEQPLRVEFLGDEIESIRIVDLTSQRSVERVTVVHVAPVATGTGTARAAAAALLRDLDVDSVARSDGAEVVLEQLQLLAEGNRSNYATFLEPLLYGASALDWLAPNCGVIVEAPEEGEAALGAVIEHDGRARSEQEQRGAIPAGLPALRCDAESVRGVLTRAGVDLEFLRFGELVSARLPIHVVPGFAGKLKPFAQQCGAWAKQGRPVIVVSQQALRLGEILEVEGIAADLRRTLTEPVAPGVIRLVPMALSGGFMIEDGLVVATDAEIFGFRKRRRPARTRAGIRSDLVSTLEVGDHLVHADHGIARYGGLIRRTVDGLEKEYIELQYAEGDRLYVPADQLDSVSRYVGPGDHPPALTRLGSGDWARARRRVRQAVIEMAAELLNLYARRELARGHAFSADGPWQMEMEAAFPFVETAEQLEAITDVKTDMEREQPMDRLICGDVGYGKTEVAIRAAFKAVGDGKQVALLVPTTVLAEQHGATFRERMAGFPVRVEVLSRFRSEPEQRAIVSAVGRGEVDIAIGTHRLLGKDVQFKDLGLVVIDEEQRFGVIHKERLKQMRQEVDTLTLSATPIPRTLQMSLHGIRDMSTIMTPPEERLPIQTYVLGWDNEIVREAIDREMQRGGQVFFVHNRVQNIERMVTRLQALVPEANIAVGHGQMPEEQLERVMMEFAAGVHDILVCTTIIESGLDIPNVNTILINNADMFGLAQLYQLRGRVGRGANRAHAYLLYDKDRTMTEQGSKRLEAIFEATELGAGFQIALRDLEIRGAGNVLGTEQSGHIAAVGFEMYAKLVAEAVGALKASLPGAAPAPASLPPPPSIDLPLSAHIPDNYIEDIHDRLNVYQRVANVETPEGVAAMQEELRDRFGPVPIAVEHLLYVSLVRSVARHARVESIKTDEHMFHLRVRNGIPDGMRLRVEALKLEGLLVGPNQVRIDRQTHANRWMPALVRILRAMAEGM